MTLEVVHLVGAGPGDPGLVTRRAARLLAGAEVVVVDRRATDAVADLAPSTATRTYVGRTPAGPAWTTAAIVDLLAAQAAAGKVVVRLKSGDPFVCSRGAEEHLALLARRVPVEVTPGVTSATAAGAATGFPVGTTLTIASGDRDETAAPVDWPALADPVASLVVLTGRAQQRTIGLALRGAGLPDHHPVALVHAAITPACRVVRTTLAGLGSTRLPPPTAIVVGPRDENAARARP